MSQTVENLRNIALVGHGGSGKTSLAEVLLFDAGVTNRLGRVEDGNTVMDFEAEELKRNSSINSAFHQYDWDKYTVSLIDTPGDSNFFEDTNNSIQAADGITVVIDAVDGVKVQTEQAWELAQRYQLPALILINKLDRERADFKRAVDDAVKCLETKPLLLQLPIGVEADFKGVVDLITREAFIYKDGKASITDIPADMQDDVETEREVLVENIAETDDDLLERYFEEETLSDEELMAALKKGVSERAFTPVLCCSATHHIGIDQIQKCIVNYMPSPAELGARTGLDADGETQIECLPDPDAPFSAFVFKTIADPYAGRLSIFRIVSGTLGGDGNIYNPGKDAKERFTQLLRIAGKEQQPIQEAGPGAIAAVAKLKETTTGDSLCDESNPIRYEPAKPLPSLISFALVPKSKADEDKLFGSLAKLLEEDVALKLDRNAETNEILLSGRGHVHIEATIEKLKRKYSVEVILNTPKVPYRETIKKKVRVQGKHKKQSGGHGQYGDCWVQMEPLPSGQGFEFVNSIVGGSIPKTYIPAVEKGIVEAAVKGVLAGFPCVDFRAILDDGTYHSVDSSEMAFKIAGSLAFKKAIAEANPVLLEPIMDVTVTTPDECMGDIMGDLNSRRGRVLGVDTKGKNQIINAQVPMAEFLTYAPDLNSMTGGRGIFTMEFARYDEVPAQIAEKLLEVLNKEDE
jgi:elongation factor G